MKHFTLNLRWLIMSLVLCVGGGTAWGEEQTITINYNSSFTPALPTANGNTTETEHTVEGLTIKEKSIYKGTMDAYKSTWPWAKFTNIVEV